MNLEMARKKVGTYQGHARFTSLCVNVGLERSESREHTIYRKVPEQNAAGYYVIHISKYGI